MERYSIQIEGEIPRDWSDWFDGFEIVTNPGKTNQTIMVGEVRDQAQLRSILERIWDLNLKIIHLNRFQGVPNQKG